MYTCRCVNEDYEMEQFCSQPSSIIHLPEGRITPQDKHIFHALATTLMYRLQKRWAGWGLLTKISCKLVPVEGLVVMVFLQTSWKPLCALGFSWDHLCCWGHYKSWTLDSGVDSWAGLWTGLLTEFCTEVTWCICKWLKLLFKVPWILVKVLDHVNAERECLWMCLQSPRTHVVRLLNFAKAHLDACMHATTEWLWVWPRPKTFAQEHCRLNKLQHSYS